MTIPMLQAFIYLFFKINHVRYAIQVVALLQHENRPSYVKAHAGFSDILPRLGL